MVVSPRIPQPVAIENRETRTSTFLRGGRLHRRFLALDGPLQEFGQLLLADAHPATALANAVATHPAGGNVVVH